MPDYFKKNLNQNIFCYLIREKEDIAACAFLLVVEKPMSPVFITGRTRTISRKKRFAAKEIKSGTQDAHTLIQFLKVLL